MATIPDKQIILVITTKRGNHTTSHDITDGYTCGEHIKFIFLWRIRKILPNSKYDTIKNIKNYKIVKIKYKIKVVCDDQGNN